MMKKTLLLFSVALLALAGCRKETPAARDAYDLSSLRFEFSIEYPETSKAVKSGWVSGDKVFILFSGVTTAYVSLTYGDDSWGEPVLTVTGDGDTPTLPSSGTLTAVYLPYGKSAAPAYSGSAWSFSAGADSYFLAAEKVNYFITDPSVQAASVIATLYMAPREGYVQFFVPYAGADGSTIRLACNSVVPAGLDGIAEDGTVAEASGMQGGWMTGYADTIGEEEGYYVSGKVVDSPGLNYYFALEHGTSPSYYKNSYKGRTEPVAQRGAYKLPAFGDWPVVQNSAGVAFVELAGLIWASANLGAAGSWELGTPCAFDAVDEAISDAYDGPKTLAMDAEWTALLDPENADWIPLTVAGTSGFLVVDKSGATPLQFFFLPRGANYWTKEGHYLQVDVDTAPELVTAGEPPAEAYVRVITSTASLYVGGFVSPVDGHEI